jgi:hypothetical protein
LLQLNTKFAVEILDFFVLITHLSHVELITHLTQNEQNEEARDFEKSINSKSEAIFY